LVFPHSSCGRPSTLGVPGEVTTYPDVVGSMLMVMVEVRIVRVGMEQLRV